MGTGVSNAKAKRAIAGRYKSSAAIAKGVFVARAAAGTIATETTHNAASHGVTLEDIASGAFGNVQRFGVVEMTAAAPLEDGMAIRSTGSGYANRKTVTGELAIDSSIGLDAEVSAAMDDDEVIEWTSTHDSDIGKYLMVIGVDTDDSTEKKELIGPLAATGTYVAGTTKWSGTAGNGNIGFVLMSENNAHSPVAAAGTVTARSGTSNTTIATISAASQSAGVLIASKATGHEGVSAGGGQITAVSDTAGTKYIIYYGISSAGTELIELEQLNGVTPVTSTGAFDVIRYVVMSDVAAAHTITFTGANDTTNTTKGYAVSSCKGRGSKVLVDLVAP